MTLKTKTNARLAVAASALLVAAAIFAGSSVGQEDRRDRRSERSSSSERSSDRSDRSSRERSERSSRSSESGSSSAAQQPSPTPAAPPAPAPAPVQAVPTGPAPADFTANYGILSEKNIFVRGRPPTRRGGTPSNTSSYQRRPEESLVLTGTALQEGRHVAFIEDTSARSTKRLVVGDSILDGKVAAIDFNGLEFEAGERKSRISVGRNFLGAAAPAPSSSLSPTTGPSGVNGGGAATVSPPAGAPGAAPPPADEAGLSVVERMKRARAREMGQPQQ